MAKAPHLIGMHCVEEGNHMLRIFFAIAMIAIGVNASLAQQDVIKERKQLMRENGNQAKLGSEMARGEKPFDLAAARKIFAQFEQTATRAATLWPQNSMDQSTADDPYSSSPKIWERMEDFRARLAKFGSDSKTAGESVKDLDSFKSAFTDIGKNDCGGCHEKYRLKKG
jgi:cytochrome c556